MAEDVFGVDGDAMATEASNGVDDEASRGSRHVILGGVLADSDSSTSIGQGSSCRSFGSYEGDAFDDGADSAQGSEERFHTRKKHDSAALDPREHGARGCSRSKAPSFLPGHGKTATCCDQLERSRLAEASEESPRKNRVDGSFEAVGRVRPKREDITNNGGHGSHDTDTQTETATSEAREEQPGTQPRATVSYRPDDSHERAATAWSSCPPARWPSPRSVQLSHEYIFYACEAGDYAKKRSSDEGYTKSGGRGHRRLSRRRRKPGPRRGQIRPASSREKKGPVTTITRPCRGEVGDTTEVHRGGMPLGREEEEGGMANGSAATGRELHEMGNSANEERCARRKQRRASLPVKEEPFTSNSRHLSRGDSMDHRHHPNEKGMHSRGGDRRRDGGEGYDLSGGLPIMERDMRGAIVAVWLAWGVRIDAVREKLRQEEGWLEAAHRTEIEKLGRFILVESSGRKGKTGITPEILEYVAKEAALRESGDADLAERIRGEALRARTKHVAERRDVLRLRRPSLEAALKQQQVAELLLVRSWAGKIESKLVRARDEAVRLLQLHLSRARRLVSAGVAAMATSCRSGHKHNKQMPVLREADLLKLGKVLLLAQETANDSIARALRTPAGKGGGGIPANTARGVTRTQSTCRVSSPQAEAINDEPSPTHVHRGLSTSPYRENPCDDGTSRMNGVEGTRTEVKGPTQGRHGAINAASSASSRPRRPLQVRISNRADTDTDTATDRAVGCLWCDSASFNRRERRQCLVPGRSPQRYNNFRNLEHLRPCARLVPWTEAAAHHHELLQQRRRRLSVRERSSTPRNLFRPNSCGDGGSHTKVSELERIEAERSIAISPPGNAAECTDVAVAGGVPGTASGLNVFRSPTDQLFDGKHRLLIRGGRGFTAPHLHFCSWECAGRWNAAFSPAQTRHERGLKIDIAAGRIVRNEGTRKSSWTPAEGSTWASSDL